MEDLFAEDDLNCGSLALDVSEEKNFNMTHHASWYDNNSQKL